MKVNNLDLQQLANLLTDLQDKADAREKENLLLSRDLLSKSEQAILVDTREKVGLCYAFSNSYRKCLAEGDYSINTCEGLTVIERKSLDDFVSSLVWKKDTFPAELERMRKYENKAIVVEATYSQCISGLYHSKTHPNSLEGLAMSASTHYGLPIFYLENFKISNIFVQRYLIAFYNKKQNEKKGIKGILPQLKKLDDYLIPVEETIISLSLDGFIEQVTQNKEEFKKQLSAISIYQSKGIVIKACYSDLLNRNFHSKVAINLLQNIVFSLIIDYSIPVYFLESECVADRWINKWLSRFKPEEIKIKKKTKKENKSLFS